MQTRPKVVAHRGFSGKYPENSTLAFEKSIKAKADMIELDIRITKDKEIIVIHDLDLKRTSDGEGSVEEMTLAEIHQYDIGSWLSPRFTGQRVPLLRDVLRLCKANGMELNIEIKATEHTEIVPMLNEMLIEEDFLQGVIVSSFDIPLLEALKEINPEIPCGYLFDKTDIMEVLKESASKGFEAIHPRWLRITPEAKAEADRLGIMINCWTVNLEEDMQSMIELGVNGIITNYPDLLWTCLA